MSFCGDYNFRNNVINGLYGCLPPQLLSVINWRYDEMRKNTCLPHQYLPQPNPPISGVRVLTNTKDTLLEVNSSLFTGVNSLTPFWSSPNVGHDLPTWMDEPLDIKPSRRISTPVDFFDFKRKKIMIISQDPLRKGKPHNNMYLSSVFGMHSISWRGNRTTTQIFNRLVKQEDCCVYLTDYNKLYVNGSNISHLSSVFKNMLDVEIRLFNPDKIVTLGKAASSALLGASFNLFPNLPTPYSYTPSGGNPIPVVPLYHTNYRMTSSFYMGKGYKSKVDLYVGYMR